MAVNVAKGYVKVLGYGLYYRKFVPEMRKKGTILCLHGGPGMTLDYILPLADLSRHGYEIFFYDQLGCGRSERPMNLALFTIERAVEEVETFRQKMISGKIHLIGSSYGGLLALAYAIKYQKYLKSVTTIGGYVDVPLAISEMEKMKKHLPVQVQKIMAKYESAGEYNNPKYLDAVNVFYKKHLCRLNRWPKELDSSLHHISKRVYYQMNGPNEFTIIGNTRYWNASERLETIRVPTLVTGGKFDEISPKVASGIHRSIKGSKQVIFQRSSHLPMWEERDLFVKTVKDFLESVE